MALKLLKNNDFNVTHYDTLKDDDLRNVKDSISLLWDNKREILDPNEIDTISEQHNGINFK